MSKDEATRPQVIYGFAWECQAHGLLVRQRGGGMVSKSDIEIVLKPLDDPGVFVRAETGPVQFGTTDWPGVFVRGDMAAGYEAALRHVLARFEAEDFWTGTQVGVLRELVELLKKCDQADPTPKIVLRSWNECQEKP